MDTKELERFCPWARQELVGAVRRGMMQLGVDESGRAQWPAGSEAVAGRALSPEERERRDRLMAGAAAAGDAAFAEREAYSWFNRLMALRYMELHGLLPWGGRALSAADGSFAPELATRAADLPLANLDRAAYLERAAESDDEGAFRLALEAACAELAGALPGVFEGASCDLLPKGLLARGEHNVVQHLVEDVPEASWKDVEALGWAYQFYNSELHRKFYDGKGKASKDDLPAATQLFTPDWIVRYMVQNSLGRLWMLNNPESPLRDKMEFYIEPDAEHEDFLRISGPEEITFCDPACGSGHILVYAFRLLTEMYRERGWRDRDIARSILESNLSGYEIDPRAAQIAQTALCMEALALDRRWLNRGVAADVRVLQNIELDEEQVPDALAKSGLADAISHLGEVGSLLDPGEADLAALDAAAAAVGSGDLLGANLREQLLEARGQLEALSRRFDVVVANPPYLGSSKFNPWMTKWMKSRYPDTCRDLFSAFIERIARMADKDGEIGIMCPFVWMFIGSYEKLRNLVIDDKTITSLVQLEYSGFEGATVPICTFTLHNSKTPGYRGGYVRLSDFVGAANQAPKTLEAIQNPDCGWFHRADASTFHDIPGSPIAYWVGKSTLDSFRNLPPLRSLVYARVGLITGDGNRFLRRWTEVSIKRISYGTKPGRQNATKWVPYTKGGEYRLWYGNNDYVVNWEDSGKEMIEDNFDGSRPKAHNFNGAQAFKEGISWNSISSSFFHCRYTPSGFMFDAAGPLCEVLDPDKLNYVLGLLSSTVVRFMLGLINPTLNFPPGYVSCLPYAESPEMKDPVSTIVDDCVAASKADWDSQETSWDFKRNPLI